MEINYKKLEGTEKQIAYASKLLKKAVNSYSYYDEIEGMKEAISELSLEEISAGLEEANVIPDKPIEDLSEVELISYMLETDHCDDNPDEDTIEWVEGIHKLAKALRTTSAHEVIELLKCY